MIKLTIGIPTFNSRDFLKETIDKTLAQIESLNGVELLICDNASTDGTQVLVEEYVRKFSPVIRYVRHQSNLGMDRNFWSVIQNAEGEFVHLLADDDFYTQDGVRRVYDKISTHSLDVVLLSNNYLNTCNGRIIQNKEVGTEDILCRNGGEEFFLNENLKTLCLSNIVIRRSKCIAIADVEKYFGCQWLHVALLTRVMGSESKAYIFNFKAPVVTVRIGNQKWLEKDGAVVFYYQALSIFEGLKRAGYSREVFEHIKTLFLPIVLNGDRINFNKTYMNVFYCFKFFKFYYNMPKQYLLFCVNLVFRRHRPFFEGWESLGD